MILKKLKNNERGSITVFVLATMLLVTGVIFIAYFSMMNKSSSQERELDKIQEEYNKTDDMMTQEYEENLYIGWNEEKGCNEPEIQDNMELVKWDEEAEKFVPDETNSSYDYNNQEWANAVVTIDGVESYFVWIPRYAYKINYTTPGTPSSGGTIDVKFLKGMSNIASDGTVCKYADDSTLDKTKDYIIHPAFTSNTTLGGWDSELPGIWVGKYETSLVKKSNKTDFSPETATTIDSETYAITIQPNKKSWRFATIDNQYTVAKEYSTELNSHMLKNSEWGAVVYLTESKYGRNGTEVTKNVSTNFLTASGDIVKNKLQSSTGNETGIYDLRGGVSERVAAYLQGGNVSNGKTLASEEEKKYVTVYTKSSETTAYKPGDATYETKGWHNDYAFFFNSSNSFLERGGDYNFDSNGAGIFFYNAYNGSPNTYTSFRMCLIIT